MLKVSLSQSQSVLVLHSHMLCCIHIWIILIIYHSYNIYMIGIQKKKLPWGKVKKKMDPDETDQVYCLDNKTWLSLFCSSSLCCGDTDLPSEGWVKCVALDLGSHPAGPTRWTINQRHSFPPYPTPIKAGKDRHFNDYKSMLSQTHQCMFRLHVHTLWKGSLNIEYIYM